MTRIALIITQGCQLGLAAGALISAGCDLKGSLGDYPQGGDEGSPPTAGTSTSTSAGSGASSIADEGIDTPLDVGNDDDAPPPDLGGGSEGADDEGVDDEGGVFFDIGALDECEVGCVIECSEGQCGPLSAFDELGCVRRSCTADADCDDGQRCYVGPLFDECISSGLSCVSNDDGVCQCGGEPDCGGGRCVEEGDFPLPEAGPSGPARIDDACAPDDGPAKELSIGLEEPSCLAPLAGGPTIRFTIDDLTPGQTGVFPIGFHPGMANTGRGLYDDGVGEPRTLWTGSLTITEYTDFAAGQYEVWVARPGDDGYEHLGGTFDLAEDCGGAPMCG